MTIRSLLLAGFATPFALPAIAAELELWRLDCGSIKVADKSMFSDTFGYGGEALDLTNSCYLIRHDDSYMLWDAGLPAEMKGRIQGEGAMEPTLARTLPEQLADLDIGAGQISIIGISHYHFDHVGQAGAFPGASLMIGAADLEALRAESPPSGAEPALLAPWLDGGSTIEAVSGDHDVFGDGSVVVITAPGHTPGSSALLLRLPETGNVILSGDIVHFEQQFETGGVPPFNTNRADSLASMGRLAGMRENLDALLVVQHDPAGIDTLPVFPDSAK
jgi:N-acyl homoserine lactone hydrolase